MNPRIFLLFVPGVILLLGSVFAQSGNTHGNETETNGWCSIEYSGPLTVDFGTISIGDTARCSLRFYARAFRDRYCSDAIGIDKTPGVPFVGPRTGWAGTVTLDHSVVLSILFSPRDTMEHRDHLAIHQGAVHVGWDIRFIGKGRGTVMIDDPDTLVPSHPLPLNPKPLHDTEVQVHGTAGEIRFEVTGKEGPVHVEVVNLYGTTVHRLDVETQTAGTRVLIWQTQGVPGGVYIYRAIVGSEIVTGKVLVRQ